jgi:hypothetical protein
MDINYNFRYPGKYYLVTLSSSASGQGEVKGNLFTFPLKQQKNQTKIYGIHFSDTRH